LIYMLKLFHILAMNLWVYPLLILWTLTGSIICLPALGLCRLATGWSTAKIMHWFIWIYGRVCVLIFRPFIRIQSRDLRKELLPGPGIIIINHYSFFDTYILCLLPVFDAHICLRSWPFRMFWYSFFMRIAQYYDFESLPWAEIRQKVEPIKQMGRYLVIFPEGHRSRTGKTRRFYSGAFKLAVEFNLPILPLCIWGTQTLLPPGRWWVKPADIKLQLLPPVYPDAFTGERAHADMRKYVHQQMVKTIEHMEKS
jgi:1-acyl-sn-glycerol-3-phosphate acyltransferase